MLGRGMLSNIFEALAPVNAAARLTDPVPAIALFEIKLPFPASLGVGSDSFAPPACCTRAPSPSSSSRARPHPADSQFGAVSFRDARRPDLCGQLCLIRLFGR